MRDGALEFASTSGGGGQLPPFQGLCGGDASACTKVLTAEVRLETKQPISSHHRQALSEEITFVLNGASGVITVLFLGRWRLGQKSHAGAWALIAAVTHKAGLMWVVLGQGARGLFYYAFYPVLFLFFFFITIFKPAEERSCGLVLPLRCSMGQRSPLEGSSSVQSHHSVMNGCCP